MKLNEGVRNFRNTLGISFVDAVDCATINPARCLGVDDRKGSIEVGKDADLIVVDENFNVYMTICRGKVVYSNLLEVKLTSFFMKKSREKLYLNIAKMKKGPVYCL